MNAIDVEKMFTSMPKTGIGIHELAEILDIDDTNYRLFSRYVKVMSRSADRGWVIPSSNPPTEQVLEKIYEEEKKITKLPKLKNNQYRRGRLIGDITVYVWHATESKVIYG